MKPFILICGLLFTLCNIGHAQSLNYDSLIQGNSGEVTIIGPKFGSPDGLNPFPVSAFSNYNGVCRLYGYQHQVQPGVQLKVDANVDFTAKIEGGYFNGFSMAKDFYKKMNVVIQEISCSNQIEELPYQIEAKSYKLENNNYMLTGLTLVFQDGTKGQINNCSDPQTICEKLGHDESVGSPGTFSFIDVNQKAFKLNSFYPATDGHVSTPLNSKCGAGDMPGYSFVINTIQCRNNNTSTASTATSTSINQNYDERWVLPDTIIVENPRYRIYEQTPAGDSLLAKLLIEEQDDDEFCNIYDFKDAHDIANKLISDDIYPNEYKIRTVWTAEVSNNDREHIRYMTCANSLKANDKKLTSTKIYSRLVDGSYLVIPAFYGDFKAGVLPIVEYDDRLTCQYFAQDEGWAPLESAYRTGVNVSGSSIHITELDRNNIGEVVVQEVDRGRFDYDEFLVCVPENNGKIQNVPGKFHDGFVKNDDGSTTVIRPSFTDLNNGSVKSGVLFDQYYIDSELNALCKYFGFQRYVRNSAFPHFDTASPVEKKSYGDIEIEEEKTDMFVYTMTCR